MLVKKYLGKTLTDMGFVTTQQLDEALERQRKITREMALEERLQRVRLVSEARRTRETEVIPLLGQILTDMGFVSEEQLARALKEQEKSFEQFMALENEKLGTVIEIGSLVNSTLNLAEVLHLIMKHANRVTNSVASTLMLIDEETGELVFSVPTGPKENQLIDVRIPPGEGIAGWVVENEKPLLIPDVNADSRFYRKVDETSGFETKSVLCIPLKAKTKMIGALEVINKLDGTCFTEKDELLMSMFGYQASVAIENARLCGELKAQLEKHKQTEALLRESEVNYSTVVENSKDGIIIIIDRLLRFVNQASIDIVGYPPEEMIGEDFLNFVSPDHRDLVLKRYTDRMEGKDVPSIYEIELLRKNGDTIQVELNAVRVDFEDKPADLVFLRDITERKRSEEAFKQSEDRYRNLVETTLDGYFVCEIPSRRFLFLNNRSLDLFGYTLQEALALTVWDVISIEDHGRVQKRSQARSEGKTLIGEHQTYTAVRKDGSTFRAEVSSARVIFHGRPVVQGIIRDVTEKERLEKQLQQSQKMEALGTLAGGIAHDFNNLLMGIQGRASLMKMATHSGHPHFEQLKGIEDYVKSATELTRQLLGFARGGKYEVKPTNLNEIIKKQNHLFGRTRKEISIRGEYQENCWTADVDSGQIEQVLLNLYVNAWQAMPGGGTLNIQTENILIDETFGRLYQAPPGKYVRISVSDTGVGMDDATRHRIFEPFFTTKDMKRGTGLGLASVYGIIKNHGGFIDVRSKKGKGTTFDVYLPASEKEVVEENRVHKEVLKGTETVLLVDDEEMVIDVGEQIFIAMGYKVLTTRRGDDAVNIYKKNREKISLVVLDMIMPGMSGGETYDRLKEVDPDVKVLLSSGYSVDGKATEILERGCNGFIQKPFNIEDLSKKIRTILDT